MANIVKPPCDEATILVASSVHPFVRYGRWVLAATILGSSFAFIDGTVVNVALPALQSAFGATVSEIQWIVECYALFLAALLLVGGSLGDRYGRRKIFTARVVIFGMGSAWCGSRRTLPTDSCSRTARCRRGSSRTGSLGLISASFPAEERGRSIGTCALIAGAIGIAVLIEYCGSLSRCR